MSRFTHQGAMARARSSRTMKTMLGVAVAGATLATVPAVASAGTTTVGLGSGLLSVIASSGDTNSYFIRKVGTDVVVLETGSSTVTATAPCSTTSSKRAVCPIGSVNTVGVNADDLNDTIDVDVPGIVSTYLNGSSGDDTLKGTNQSVSDTFVGGSGTDTVSFAGVSYVVFANLNGLKDDSYGVVDHIQSSVEGIIGGNNDDDLTGAPSSVFTTSRIFGGPGNDTITSGGGDTYFEGDGGNDTLTGGAGIDWLYGGSGSDALDGKGGDDILDVNDGAGGDTVKCGAGTLDYVPFNLGDTILDSPNCEQTQLF